MTKEQYNKHPKSFEDQVDLLKARGLIIENDERAIKILTYISYNRLSNYWWQMLAEPKDEEQFIEGSKFITAFRSYQFDSRLRAYTFHAIEQIEIAIRTQVIYHLSHKHGSGYWYVSPASFDDFPKFVNFLTTITKRTHDSTQEFILKYQRKYTQYLPPSWKSFELLSFTCLLGILKNLKDKKDLIPISKSFGIHHSVLISWIESLVYVRNICAHHSRLWNIILTISPTWPKRTDNPWVTRWENEDRNIDTKDKVLKYYSIFCIISYLLSFINPYNSYAINVDKLLLDFDDHISISDLGFPEKWKEEKLWETMLKAKD